MLKDNLRKMVKASMQEECVTAYTLAGLITTETDCKQARKTVQEEIYRIINGKRSGRWLDIFDYIAQALGYKIQLRLVKIKNESADSL